MKMIRLTESLYKNKKAMGLVSLMSPLDLMKSLMKNFDLLPKEAAKIVLDLKKRSEEGLSGFSIEKNKEFPVPSVQKDQKEENKITWGGPHPSGISNHHFPPEPREEPLEFPYDDTFKNYMNGPKRKKPILNSKKKDPFKTDLTLNSPGYAGNGTQINFNKSSGDQSSSSSSWSTQGVPGWSRSSKEFEVPPHSLKKKDRKPVEDKVPNAGDEDDFPKHLKSPNVGQTIPLLGYGGATPVRLNPKGHRGYGRK